MLASSARKSETIERPATNTQARTYTLLPIRAMSLCLAWNGVACASVYCLRVSRPCVCVWVRAREKSIFHLSVDNAFSVLTFKTLGCRLTHVRAVICIHREQLPIFLLGFTPANQFFIFSHFTEILDAVYDSYFGLCQLHPIHGKLWFLCNPKHGKTKIRKSRTTITLLTARVMKKKKSSAYVCRIVKSFDFIELQTGKGEKLFGNKAKIKIHSVNHSYTASINQKDESGK